MEVKTIQDLNANSSEIEILSSQANKTISYAEIFNENENTGIKMFFTGSKDSDEENSTEIKDCREEKEDELREDDPIISEESFTGAKNETESEDEYSDLERECANEPSRKKQKLSDYDDDDDELEKQTLVTINEALSLCIKQLQEKEEKVKDGLYFWSKYIVTEMRTIKDEKICSNLKLQITALVEHTKKE